MKVAGITLILAALLFGACKVDDEISPVEIEDRIVFEIPQGFPAPVYTFDNNPLTTEGFKLGRKLFYDPILSRDNSISCGSCHQQFAAFSHLDHSVSHGIDGLLGTRNAPPLFNLAWHSNFMWDGGVNHLEVQPLQPITNPVEMDETISNVISKLQNHAEYPTLFKSAFKVDTINSQLMLRAFAQFMAMMVSADSRYDKYMRGEISLDNDESEGLQLFRQKCESCHREPLFTDLSYRNNGLDMVFSDSGRAVITQLSSDVGKFKVPSLRNIAVSKPYMHDGRFETLNEILHHYTSGINNSQTLDTMLAGGIQLTSTEKQKITAFLNALTDNTFLFEEKFSENQ